VQLVERAKALLARRRPGMTLGELHLEAMRLLVGALEKKKFAVTERPRQRDDATEDAQSETEAPRQRVTATERDRPDAIAPRQRVTVTESDQQDTKPGKRRERSRYIPAEVRREVYGRDGARCTYIDARGQRCPETHYLELHHLWPFAKNGVSVASNLTLRCASHNALAAEQDFGSAVMARRRDSTTHQARAHQQLFGKPPFR
jgi:5-methylcytosine-specific restriction endonuclease McrA